MALPSNWPPTVYIRWQVHLCCICTYVAWSKHCHQCMQCSLSSVQGIPANQLVLSTHVYLHSRIIQGPRCPYGEHYANYYFTYLPWKMKGTGIYKSIKTNSWHYCVISVQLCKRIDHILPCNSLTFVMIEPKSAIYYTANRIQWGVVKQDLLYLLSLSMMKPFLNMKIRCPYFMIHSEVPKYTLIQFA